MALDGPDRTLRFGVISDADAVARYIAAIDFECSTVLGATERDSDALVGLAHVALADGVADLGLSVASDARRRGVGRALAAAALREAQRLDAVEFRFDGATANTGMRRLAKHLGMRVDADGSEFVARRLLGRAAAAPPGMPALAVS